MSQFKWKSAEENDGMLSLGPIFSSESNRYLDPLNYGNDDSIPLEAPTYNRNRFLNTIDWKNPDYKESFQEFIDDKSKDTEDWKIRRYLTTLSPGMTFGLGGTSYKIVADNDKRLIPNGYEAIGSMPGYSRLGYQTGSDRIRYNVPGFSIPGYTILQKTSPDKETKKIEISKEPIDFSPRYIKPKYNYTPTPNKKVSSQSFDQLLTSRDQTTVSDNDIRKALNLG